MRRSSFRIHSFYKFCRLAGKLRVKTVKVKGNLSWRLKVSMYRLYIMYDSVHSAIVIKRVKAHNKIMITITFITTSHVNMRLRREMKIGIQRILSECVCERERVKNAGYLFVYGEVEC